MEYLRIRVLFRLFYRTLLILYLPPAVLILDQLISGNFSYSSGLWLFLLFIMPSLGIRSVILHGAAFLGYNLPNNSPLLLLILSVLSLAIISLIYSTLLESRNRSVLAAICAVLSCGFNIFAMMLLRL